MVKCAECGLLAVRHLATGELHEMQLEWRTQGTYPNLNLYCTSPLCLVTDEVFLPLQPGNGECVERMTEERECEFFLVAGKK